LQNSNDSSLNTKIQLWGYSALSFLIRYLSHKFFFMIRYFLLSAILVSSLFSLATVRTVNNYITNSAQFSTVQPAITASATNDTIYLHGSPVSYGDFTITKRLVIMGAGYNLTNTINNYTTNVGNITVDTVTVNQALSGLTLQGLAINGSIGCAGTDRANNVLIDRCRVPAGGIGLIGSNWTIKNSFGNLTINMSSVSSNILISNNILQSLYITNGTSLTNYAAGVKVSNNELGGLQLVGSYYVMYVNNIVKNSSNNGTNNTFSRNITFTDGGPSINFPPPNNTGSGNFNNINPLYINYSCPWSACSQYSGDLLSYDFNYQTGSVAINGGTDSTNIGISGGPYPTLTTKIFDGRTKIPLVVDVNIENAYVKPGQSIQVHFKARKNN
jgi:hypothetical protein